MDFLGFTRSQWMETGAAAGIFAAAVLLALALSAAMRWMIRRFARAAEPELQDLVVHALRGPAVALVIVQGLAVALDTLSYLAGNADLVRRFWLAATLAIFVIALQRVLAHLMQWYAGRPVVAPAARLDPRSLPLLRRAVSLAIWLAGGLVVLDTLGIAISPLLTGLGIGGLAVALALQPLLANVFASSYMLSDQSIRVGDAVEIRGGPAGIIEDIGWRATRIRSSDNNIVIVPNSTLASAIVTNYDALDRHADARVTLGVAYGEDLSRVEAACLDEMTRLRDELGFAVKDAVPLFRYQGFGDSRVDILLKMRAITWGDASLLRHLLIQRIHARLSAEGITVTSPTGRLPRRAADASGLDGSGERDES